MVEERDWIYTYFVHHNHTVDVLEEATVVVLGVTTPIVSLCNSVHISRAILSYLFKGGLF